jgi:molecular chaperone DnaK
VPEILKLHPLEKFDRGNRAYRSAFAKLKMAAEKAKIELSNYENAPVLVENLFAGSDFVFETELARPQVEAIAMPIIRGSVEKCRQIITEKNLHPQDFQKLILVGGPTLAPYLRDILADPREGLGIPLDFSVDPFTVVSQGAAIYAKTQILESAFLPQVKGKVKLELKYDPIGSDPEPIIGGTASSPDIKDFNGYSVQFDREGWTSGKVPLKGNGVFITTLLAEKGIENKFHVTAFDPKGALLNTTPDEITYIIGNAPGQQVMINSIGVALMNNQTDWVFRRGEQIPGIIRKDYRTMLTMDKGKSGDFIRVPIVEGEDPTADYNTYIGELLITGENIPRSVPAGSEVEVTIKIDVNRILKTTAYIPILDKDFTQVIDLKTVRPDPEKLEEDFKREKQRTNELHGKSGKAENAKASEILIEAEKQHPTEKTQAQVTASANEEDDSGRMAEESIRERRKANDRAEEVNEWPIMVKQARASVDSMKNMMAEVGKPEDEPACQEIYQKIEEAIVNNDIAQMRYYMDELESLRWQVLTRDSGFWLYMFEKFSKDPNVRFENPDRAQHLIQEGNSAVVEGNIDKLKMVVSQLFALIPQAQVQEITRGYGSTLMN